MQQLKCWDGELIISRTSSTTLKSNLKHTEDEEVRREFWNLLERDEYFVNCTRDVFQVVLYWIMYGKYVSDVDHSKLGLKCVAEYFGLEGLIAELDLSQHFEKFSVLSKTSQSSRISKKRQDREDVMDISIDENMETSSSVMSDGISVGNDDLLSNGDDSIKVSDRRITNQEKARLKLLKQQEAAKEKENLKLLKQQAVKERQENRSKRSQGKSSSVNSIASASFSTTNDIGTLSVIPNEMRDQEETEMQCMLGSKVVSLNIERMKESGSALFSQVADPTEGFSVRVNKRGIPVIFDAVPEEFVKPIVDFINTGLVPSSVQSKPAAFKFGLAEIANVLSLQSIYSQISGLFIDFCTILEKEEQIVLGSTIAKRNMPFLKGGTWNLASSISSPYPKAVSLTHFLKQNPVLVLIQTNEEKKYGALLCAYVKSKGTPQHYKYDFNFDLMYGEIQTYNIINPTTCPHSLSSHSSVIIDLGAIVVHRNESNGTLFANMNRNTFNVPEDQLTDFNISKLEVFTWY